MKQLKNPITKVLKTGNNLLTFKTNFISILLFFLILTSFQTTQVTDKLNRNSVKTTSNFNKKDSLRYDSVLYFLNKKSIEDSLRKEVYRYIKKIAPKSKLKSYYVVNLCLKYDIDICFVLAQGHLESHFGTRGLAQVTNSVFNVGTYDDGTILYKYKNPNESIKPYINLLLDKYLTDKKSVHNLMGGFKNKNGCRYASAENYEVQLKLIYYKLINNTNINKLQKNYKYFKEPIKYIASINVSEIKNNNTIKTYFD